MNSGSEMTLSEEELLAMNQPERRHKQVRQTQAPVQAVQPTTALEPTPTPQPTTAPEQSPQQMTPPTPPTVVIQCPIPEALNRIERQIEYLMRNSSGQTTYLKQLSGIPGTFPTRTQMEDLLKRIAHLEWMIEQAGKPKEKRFSLPRFRLPRLRLPHLSGPTWAVLLMTAAALLLLWWGLGDVWNRLSMLLR